MLRMNRNGVPQQCDDTTIIDKNMNALYRSSPVSRARRTGQTRAPRIDIVRIRRNALAVLSCVPDDSNFVFSPTKYNLNVTQNNNYDELFVERTLFGALSIFNFRTNRYVKRYGKRNDFAIR